MNSAFAFLTFLSVLNSYTFLCFFLKKKEECGQSVVGGKKLSLGKYLSLDLTTQSFVSSSRRELKIMRLDNNYCLTDLV